MLPNHNTEMLKAFYYAANLRENYQDGIEQLERKQLQDTATYHANLFKYRNALETIYDMAHPNKGPNILELQLMWHIARQALGR